MCRTQSNPRVYTISALAELATCTACLLSMWRDGLGLLLTRANGIEAVPPLLSSTIRRGEALLLLALSSASAHFLPTTYGCDVMLLGMAVITEVQVPLFSFIQDVNAIVGQK
jgi:hypothetical protein